MRKLVCFVVVCLVVLGLFGQVFAQDTPADTTVTYNQDARQARINELRSLYKISLQPTERAATSLRCKAAQKNLARLGSQLSNTTILRRSTYQTSIDRLKNMQTRLSQTQIDTSNLELLTVLYQQKLETFEFASTNYALVIEDAVTIDCSTSPEDFLAALEGVRSARKKVVAVTSELQEITRSSLKTTSDTLINRLKASGQKL